MRILRYILLRKGLCLLVSLFYRVEFLCIYWFFFVVGVRCGISGEWFGNLFFSGIVIWDGRWFVVLCFVYMFKNGNFIMEIMC